MTNFLAIAAMMPQSEGAGQPPFFLQPQFITMIFMVLFMYLVLIRPQQKKQKEHQQMLSKLDKNDEVITAGGVHATVVTVNDKTVILKIADNVKIELEKASITQVTKSRQQVQV